MAIQVKTQSQAAQSQAAQSQAAQSQAGQLKAAQLERARPEISASDKTGSRTSAIVQEMEKHAQFTQELAEYRRLHAMGGAIAGLADQVLIDLWQSYKSSG